MTVDEYEAKIDVLKKRLLAYLRKRGGEVNELEIIDAFAGRDYSEACVSDVLRLLKKGLSARCVVRTVGKTFVPYWSAVRQERQLF